MTTRHTPDTWLRVAEVCAELTISRRTFGRLVEQGRLRVIHPSPGRVAVTRTELEAYKAFIERSGAA